MSHLGLSPPAAAPMSLTRHAEARCHQRSFRQRDLGLLLRHATDNGDGTFTMTRGNVDDAVVCLKKMIGALERLRGATAVVIDGRVVTVYRQPPKSRRRRHENEGDPAN